MAKVFRPLIVPKSHIIFCSKDEYLWGVRGIVSIISTKPCIVKIFYQISQVNGNVIINLLSYIAYIREQLKGTVLLGLTFY